MRKLSKITKPDIVPFSTRLKRVFAWLPKEIDGEIVWLEYYEVLQGYEQREVGFFIDGKQRKFILSEWVNISIRVKQ